MSISEAMDYVQQFAIIEDDHIFITEDVHYNTEFYGRLHYLLTKNFEVFNLSTNQYLNDLKPFILRDFKSRIKK